ncbi:MAG: beta-L-arabinofuranosidase domain-containing protein [Kiritimatiellia bacterium]
MRARVLLVAAMAAVTVFGGASTGLGAARFTQLKPGAVKPTGWLREQLRLQAEGLTGHAEELYDDIGNSTWLTHQKGKNAQYDWERGPYYARGLLPLAWQLDDERLKAKARRWVEALFGWQMENGDVGPRRENWWANMLALAIVRDWYLVSGDARSLDFITKYAKFQLEALPAAPLMRDFGDHKGSPPWASARGGDEIEVLLDVHGVTGDETLLRAARLVADQTAPWTDYYHVGTPNKAYQQHIVNFNQGLKTPAFMWRLGVGDADRNRSAYAAATRGDGWAQLYAGRPDGMQNGEEPLRDRETTGGTELCAQVERIISCADQIAVFADVAAADDMETVAYNCLPATLAPDGRGLRYYLALNQPKCTNEKTDYAHNGVKVNCLVPSPHSGFGCCRSNFHIGWPKFVQSMWMRTADGGYAAVAYGPCRLETPEVTIVETTDYPFRDRVTLEVVKGGGDFPIYVRIPRWAKERDAGSFRRIDRTWKPGERIELRFAAETVVETGWNRNAAVVRRGALLYSWPVPSVGKVTAEHGGGFVTRELHPVVAFNVALDLRGAFAAKVVDEGRPLAAQPFDVASAPVRLQVKGCRTDEAEWGTFRRDACGLMNEPPPSPIRAPQGEEVLDLVPLGCTQTRITLFPWRR